MLDLLTFDDESPSVIDDLVEEIDAALDASFLADMSAALERMKRARECSPPRSPSAAAGRARRRSRPARPGTPPPPPPGQPPSPRGGEESSDLDVPRTGRRARARPAAPSAPPRARSRTPRPALRPPRAPRTASPRTIAPGNVPTIPGPAGIMTPTTSTPRIVKASTAWSSNPKPRASSAMPHALTAQYAAVSRKKSASLLLGTSRRPDERVEHPGHACRRLGRDRPQERLRESDGERAIPVAEHEEREQRRERERHDHSARPEHPHARRAVGHREERHDEQHAREEPVRHALDHDRRERGRDPARALGDEIRPREFSEPERQDDERHEADGGDRVQPGERQLRDGLEEDPPANRPHEVDEQEDEQVRREVAIVRRADLLRDRGDVLAPERQPQRHARDRDPDERLHDAFHASSSPARCGAVRPGRPGSVHAPRRGGREYHAAQPRPALDGARSAPRPP